MRQAAQASFRVSSGAGSGGPDAQRRKREREPRALATAASRVPSRRRLRDQLAVEHVQPAFLGGQSPHLDAQTRGPRRGRAGASPPGPGRPAPRPPRLAAGATARTAASRPSGRAASRSRMTPRSESRSLSSVAVRLATSRPPTRTAKRSARRSTSPSWCDVKSTARPSCARPLHEPVEGAEAVGVERGRRLVEQEDGRLGQHRHREPEPLHHAARVGADGPLAGAVERGEAEHSRHALGAARRAACGRTPRPRRRSRASGNETFWGRNESTSARRGLGGGPWRLAERDLAGRRPDEAGRGLERRRLARPVRPEERDHLPAADLEREAVHRRAVPEALRERAIADHRAPTRIDARSHEGERQARPRRRARWLPGQAPPEPARATARADAPAERASSTGTARSTGNARSAAPIGGGGEAVGEQVGRGQVPAEVVEDAREHGTAGRCGRRRPGRARRCPTSSCPGRRCRCCRATSVERRAVADEGVALETVSARRVVEHHRDVRAGDGRCPEA